MNASLRSVTRADAGGRVSVSADIIRAILGGSGDGMPKKYQNPKLEVRRDVERPYYFVRVSVPILTEAGRRLQRQRRNLGFVDEVPIKQAKKERAHLLE